MGLETWFSFFLLCMLATMSPGPAMLLAVTHGARYGTIGTLPTVSGNITGLAIMSTASAIGIGGLLAASSDWLLILRLIGGSYLIYLGVRLIFSKASSEKGTENGPQQPTFKHRSAGHRFAQGLGVAMSNPKAIFFTAALFPQFIDVSVSVWPQLLVLALTLMTLSFMVLITCATASGKLVRKAGRNFSKQFDRITGSVFIIFGIALIAGRR